jgi:ribosomal protein S18 acetylase RimI-like enzyme
MIKIRTASPDDAPLIADLSRETFYETFAQDNTKENMDKFLELQFTREVLLKEVGAPDNIFLLAYDGDDVVGYARVRENNNPPSLGTNDAIEIARIYARKTSIGKGVGKALMQACIDIAIKKKRKFAWLGVWEKNLRAFNFYESWGFEKFDEQPFQLGDDMQTDWLMKKKIF